MELIIRSPTTVLTKNVEWIEIITSQGSLVIQNGHAPFIALVVSQDFILQTTEGIIETFKIPLSIMEVTRKSISLLLSH
jgi:F0F1-type ATP synthase epsilon subunit